MQPMLKIRLLRMGRKHDPSFRLVIVDSKKPPRSGDYVEKVGFYNPRRKIYRLQEERIRHWLSKGARPSPTVHNLLIKAEVISGRKLNLSKKKKKTATEKSGDAVVKEPEAKKEKQGIEMEEGTPLESSAGFNKNEEEPEKEVENPSGEDEKTENKSKAEDENKNKVAR
jgi:small subunit ribosomal protein S16